MPTDHSPRLNRCISLAMPFLEAPELHDSAFDRSLISMFTATTLPVTSMLRRARLRRLVRSIEQEEEYVKALSTQALHSAAEDMRGWRNTDHHGAVGRAFALAREAAERHRGIRHYPVQLLGGAVMMRGALAEMQTGEGKTLTAVLPAVAAALAGRRVHVVTVNEYLARRDATELAPVYRALGISVGLVEQGQSRAARQRAYASDVTYCTNKDLVFDYLRDRLALGRRRGRACYKLDKALGRRQGSGDSLLMQGLDFAIVDEADSVLVDEARTPLILSGEPDDRQAGEGGLYAMAVAIARRLQEGIDYELVPSERRVRLTPDGSKKVEQTVSGPRDLWHLRRARDELVRQALCALTYFRRDVHYVVAEGKVQIVDEFTGRVMPGRSWEHGLHQLIEVKEGLDTTRRKDTLEKITYQQFFRKYQHLCGMTGTAVEVAGELKAVYDLDVVRVPTNRPSAKVDRGARCLSSCAGKWAAVIASASETVSQGRAVLIGTRSVEASEQLSALLNSSGHDHAVLNAVQDAGEAEIIARAGQPGRITVATNMAGRGTDIKLHPDVLVSGGLHVILTEYHESSRIDRQLFGRAGRQGDKGSFEAIVSLDDELFQRFCHPSLLAAVRRTGGSGEVALSILHLMKSLSQLTAERIHGLSRRAAIEEARRFADALAFAGRA